MQTQLARGSGSAAGGTIPPPPRPLAPPKLPAQAPPNDGESGSAGGQGAPASSMTLAADPWADPPERATARVPRQRPKGTLFQAELDVAEFDDRVRPGPPWIARAAELSRSHLVFRSRRMCYVGRRLICAVHLVDDKPMPLCGRVVQCEYDGEGLYRVDIDLLPVPDRPEIRTWLNATVG